MRFVKLKNQRPERTLKFTSLRGFRGICESFSRIRRKQESKIQIEIKKRTGHYKVKRGSFEPLIGGRSTRRIWDSAMCVICPNVSAKAMPSMMRHSASGSRVYF